MTTPITTLAQSAANHATTLRRQLHQIPELMFEELKTAHFIRAEFRRLGVTFTDNIPAAPTATIAHIGDQSKPCIALRADIDALPITEATGVGYASTHTGRMHACGHDGHTAALLGAAAVLKQIEPDLSVCIKLIFQPAEEGGGGAQKLVEAGVLDGRLGPKPTAIFGLHGWPGLPVGTMSTKPGPLMAATDNFIARFRGKGCHGAFPHLGRDPIVAASEGVLALQQIISREINPIEPAVITVGMISGGTAVNIIPASASFEGTARTLTSETRAYVQNAMRRRLEGIAASHDVTLDLTWVEGYPPTANTPELADYARETVKTTFGADAFIPAIPGMGGEDFAYYVEQIPGCFTLVGLCPPGVESSPGLHTAQFNFNDNALPTAIRLLVALATRYTEVPGLLSGSAADDSGGT